MYQYERIWLHELHRCRLRSEGVCCHVDACGTGGFRLMLDVASASVTETFGC